MRGGGGVGWDGVGEWHGRVYTTKCGVDSWWEAAAWRGEIGSVLCDCLGGGMVGETQEGGDVGTCVYV